MVTRRGFVHVRWIIENAPESEAAGMSETLCFGSTVRREYDIAKELWNINLEKDPDNLAYLKNASPFFLWHDKELRTSCLRRGQSLEPTNPNWSMMLDLDNEEGDDLEQPGYYLRN
jgi:hypothetical protein